MRRTRRNGVLNDKKVLELFLSCPNTSISGEAMGKHFGVSRVSIWQRLVVFKEAGFELNGEPKKGYILTATPEKPYPPLISVILDKSSSPGIPVAEAKESPVVDFALSKHFADGLSEFATFSVPRRSCELSRRNTRKCPAGSMLVTLFRQIEVISEHRDSAIVTPVREALDTIFQESAGIGKVLIEFDYLATASCIQGVAITVVIDNWRTRLNGVRCLESYPFRTCPSLLIAATLSALDKTLRASALAPRT